MNNPTVIYPFSIESSFIVDVFSSYFPEHSISTLVSPKGLGLGGLDSSTVDNRTNSGYIVSENIVEALSNSSTLFLTWGKCSDPIHSDTLQIIEIALDMNIDIICAFTLDNNQLLCYKEKAFKRHLKFIYYNDFFNEYSLILNNLPEYTPHIPNIPVLFIGGLLEENNVFEIFLKITAKLRNKNFKVLALSPNIFSLLFNIYPIPYLNNAPEMNLDFHISEAEKIKQLNYYIKILQEKEIPDIIIIQMPDAILRFSELVPNGYGILTYMLSQVLNPDFALCCLQSYVGSLNEFIQYVSNDIQSRLGFPIDVFHLSNIVIDSSVLMEENSISCIYTNKDIVKYYTDRNSNVSFPLYNLIDDNSMNQLIDYIILNLFNDGNNSNTSYLQRS
jgi:peptide maturation system protein (TIGR04066 family)